MQNSALRPWKTLSKRTILELGRFLTVESHTVQWPDGQVISDWAWLIAPDAVIVLAETLEQRFLCFRQIKYAVEGPTLAPVGGMVDPGEVPLEAAKRELMEETGFESSDWTSLGSYKVDPNRGMGAIHLFLARNAEQVAAPDSDDSEDQQLLFLTRSEMETACEAGDFKALCWIAAVAMALHHLSRQDGKS